ncbi:hypothetical protein HanXRQr2_Chr11g0477081 [Helianthus annuus]|uniref:Uncharacterized protein n=1 Tax=Helianthus annuus TaxID=4232 RepID=A0A9K3HM30_HELAN|nr:hypothetical protein HanXRQr2_Chr11g0477081 [Helianthus annuus]KAJ0874078.1 hypothetical protein HanPSC8_Chr11g0459881 [Helianthus annuus]
MNNLVKVSLFGGCEFWPNIEDMDAQEVGMPEPVSDCRFSDGDTTMFYRSVSLSGFWSKHRDDVGCN